MTLHDALEQEIPRLTCADWPLFAYLRIYKDSPWVWYFDRAFQERHRLATPYALRKDSNANVDYIAYQGQRDRADT